jgi:hypothetical protein
MKTFLRVWKQILSAVLVYLAFYSVQAETSYSTLLIGINYNFSTNQNEIRTVNPNTGETCLLNSFVFDTGYWYPNTFSVDKTANRIYAMSSGGKLYQFTLDTGAAVPPAVSIDTDMQTFRAGSNGLLVGIRYNFSTNQNEIRTVNPSTGETSLLNSFVFDTGGWYSDTFSVDKTANRIYAMSSSSKLYQFTLDTGAAVPPTVSIDTNLQTLRAAGNGLFVGINYNGLTNQNEIRTVNPSTGETTLLNAFAFDSGAYNPSTFSVDKTANRIYVVSSSNTLYQFRLDTGAAVPPTVSIDTDMQTLTAISNYPTARCQNACPIYGIQDHRVSDTQFFTISPSTKAVRDLGPLHKKHDIEGLAIDQATGTLYCTSGDKTDKQGHLYRIDRETGGLTDIGPTGFIEVDSLAIRPSDGTFWGWAVGDGLITIDPEKNGQGRLIVPYNDELVEDMVWSYDGHFLYVTQGRNLLVYDGEKLDIACNNLPGSVEAVEMLPGNMLMFAFHQDNSARIHVLDINSCEVILEEAIDTPYKDIEGMAWWFACMP